MQKERGCCDICNVSTSVGVRGGEFKAHPPISSATDFPRSDRGHHVPALTVTNGERGVVSDVACSDKSSRGRERH